MKKIDGKIPQVRADLLELADEISSTPLLKRSTAKLRGWAAALRYHEQRLYREGYGRPRAPRQSVAMTNEIGAAVRVMAREFPGRTQQDIAAHFNIDSGRVSEALNGRW